MDKGKSVYVLLLTLLLVSLSVNVAQYLQRDKEDVVVDVDTITVVRYEYMKDTMPSVKSERVIGKVSIPVLSNLSNTENYVKNTADTIHTNDDMYKKTENLYIDSTEVEFNVVQRTYSDSTYTAYVSGVKVGDYPKLDSICVREYIFRETVTKITKEKELKRWNFGIVGGYGYGFCSNKFEPFLGIGVTMNLF